MGIWPDHVLADTFNPITVKVGNNEQFDKEPV